MFQLRSHLRRFHPFRRRTFTLRYMFPALALVGALLGANALQSTEDSYVRLEASESTIAVGSRFSVTAIVNGATPINAVEATLRYDGTALEVLEVDRGQSVLTIWTEDPIVETDRIVLQGGTFRRGFLGEHELINIDFRADAAGEAVVSIDDLVFLAGDGAGSDVSVTQHPQSNISLVIYDESTDPEDLNVTVNGEMVTDVTGDGSVTLQDVSAFMAAWRNQEQTYDFNNDGRMTFRDFSIILADVFLR